MNDLTPDEEDAKCKKRLERLEQNRISARESRKRKKTMIEELQRTVISLSRENKDLNERNEGFRRKLIEVGSKVSHSVSHSVSYLVSYLVSQVIRRLAAFQMSICSSFLRCLVPLEVKTNLESRCLFMYIKQRSVCVFT